MARVVLKSVKKIYAGNIVAVDNASLEVEDKEFVVLVGPSGCGKSTTLRMIAGLEEISEGEVYIGDRLVNNVPPKKRDIAMVFQNYALYPHMTVYKNMAFGLQLRKYPKSEIEQRVRQAAEILGITALLDRKPKALSGGQRQRVALGRAIVRRPKAFLFDEPLSNLDAKFRVQMRTEIIKLHLRLQATMIYVTHDQVEAMTMGDRIVVMKDGLIQQVADPITLYEKPANKFVAGFIGSPSMNFLNGAIVEGADGLCFRSENWTVQIAEPMVSDLNRYQNKKIILGIRPECIRNKLHAKHAPPERTILATVDVVEPMGSEIYLYFSTGNQTFVVRADAHDKAQVSEKLEVVLNMDKAHFFDPDTEEAII